MYENWTQEQKEQAAGRWVSTEHEGAPPDNSLVLIYTDDTNIPDPDSNDATHGIGIYVAKRDAWVIQFFATPELETYDALGYKSVRYWRCLPDHPWLGAL